MAEAVTILVRNDTAEHFLNILAYSPTARTRREEVRFLEAPSGDPQGRLFPEAWQVLALGPRQFCSVHFPMRLKLAVCEAKAEPLAPLRVTEQDVAPGEIWRFERHPKEPRFTRLSRLVRQFAAESDVALVNAAPETVRASLTRNGQTLAEGEALPRDGRVDFPCATALEWRMSSDSTGGERLPEEVMAAGSFESAPYLLELAGLQSVTLAVVVEDRASGRLGWRETDRVSVGGLDGPGETDDPAV